MNGINVADAGHFPGWIALKVEEQNARVAGQILCSGKSTIEDLIQSQPVVGLTRRQQVSVPTLTRVPDVIRIIKQSRKSHPETFAQPGWITLQCH